MKLQKGGKDFQFLTNNLVASGKGSYRFTKEYKKCLAIWGKYYPASTSMNTSINGGTITSSSRYFIGDTSGYTGGGIALIVENIISGAQINFPSYSGFVIYQME